MNPLIIVAIVVVAVIVLGKAVEAKIISPQIQVPKIVTTPQGGTTVTPAPGTAPVLPSPGAKPVQPQPYTLSPDVPVIEGQVIMLNPGTGAVITTAIANLANMAAAGYRTIICYSSYSAAQAVTNATYPYIAYKSNFGYFVVTASEASIISGGE